MEREVRRPAVDEVCEAEDISSKAVLALFVVETVFVLEVERALFLTASATEFMEAMVQKCFQTFYTFYESLFIVFKLSKLFFFESLFIYFCLSLFF